jgi:hypothetical protein
MKRCKQSFDLSSVYPHCEGRHHETPKQPKKKEGNKSCTPSPSIGKMGKQAIMKQRNC